jgi:hypothetical protein
MNLHFGKLNRLRDMSLGEALGRGRQEIAKLADRFLTPDEREIGAKSLITNSARQCGMVRRRAPPKCC